MSRRVVSIEEKNTDFTQVYNLGWDVMRQVVKLSPIALEVFVFLAQHSKESNTSITITQEELASELGVSRRSIISATKLLDDLDIIPRIKVSGNAYLYALNPEHIWKAKKTAKGNAMYHSLVILPKKSQEKLEARINKNKEI